MKKEIVTVITAGVLVTGCESSLQHESNPTGPQAAPGSAEHIVTVPPLPAQLPEAVKKREPASVAVWLRLGSNTMVSTGVRVGSGKYLTAVHELIDDTGRLLQAASDCGSLTVQSATQQGTASTTTAGTSTGTSYDARGFVGSRPINSERVPDLAMIAAANDDQTTGSPKIAPSAPAAPSSLFTISFEPTADLRLRTPDLSKLSEPDRLKHLDKPVIMGLTMVGTNDTGQYVAIDRQRSYGISAENQIRPGASGSPVYDAKGMLIGLIVRYIPDISSEQLDRTVHATVRSTATKWPDAVIIQPVMPITIADYNRKITPIAHCQPS